MFQNINSTVLTLYSWIEIIFHKIVIKREAGIAQSVWRLATGWTIKGSDFESR
jgi:hypothetical protein